MFLYLNFRKNAGLVGQHAFHKEEKVAPVLLAEIKQLIANTKNEHGGYGRPGPDSKELDAFIAGLNKPSIPELRELIQKYEAWASPFAGTALFHDIQEHTLVKDSH